MAFCWKYRRSASIRRLDRRHHLSEVPAKVNGEHEIARFGPRRYQALVISSSIFGEARIVPQGLLGFCCASCSSTELANFDQSNPARLHFLTSGWEQANKTILVFESASFDFPKGFTSQCKRRQAGKDWLRTIEAVRCTSTSRICASVPRATVIEASITMWHVSFRSSHV